MVRNEKPLGIGSSLKEAIKGCLDEEIVVLVDGSDWLAHEWVLERLNQYYANPDLWITHGQFLYYPAFDPKAVSAFSVAPLYLPTFYASFFKGVDPSPDVYMESMLERAKDHFQSIDQIKSN